MRARATAEAAAVDVRADVHRTTTGSPEAISGTRDRRGRRARTPPRPAPQPTDSSGSGAVGIDAWDKMQPRKATSRGRDDRDPTWTSPARLVPLACPCPKRPGEADAEQRSR